MFQTHPSLAAPPDSLNRSRTCLISFIPIIQQALAGCFFLSWWFTSCVNEGRIKDEVDYSDPGKRGGTFNIGKLDQKEKNSGMQVKCAVE